MLINSTTQLNKLKFTSSGGDRWDQGKSGQPYIVTPIPGADDTFVQQLDGTPLPKGGVDFLLRGGLLSVDSAINDVSRLTQMMFDTKSPNGFEFIAKQNVLSRNNVKTEASFGVGYAGGGLNQGVYTPVGTLLQTGLAPLATGATNLFGINPFTDRTPLTDEFTKTNNGGLNSYFGTVNIQNTANDENNNRLVALNDGIVFGYENKVVGGNIILNPDNAGVNVLKYGGGPGSILGIGSTNIRFSDQRTGLQNAKLPKSADGGPAFINPEGPNNYGVFGKSPNYPTVEASITGVTTNSPDVSTIFKGNLFVSGSTASSIFAGLFNDQADKLVEGLGITLNAPTYEGQDPGAIANKFNVYSEGLTSDKAIIEVNGASTLTQAQLYDRELASVTGKTNVSDFRYQTSRGIITDATIFSSSAVLSIAPEYQIMNKNNRVEQGDPGQGTNVGIKNVLRYGIPAETLTALDKINAQKMYESQVVDRNKAINDLVKFRIAVINNDKADGTATYIHFRAFIDSFSDNYGANWDSVKYVGRGEELYNYAGFTREVSMDFTVFAQSKAELIPMYKKLNYLASTLAPDYNAAGFMRGNIVRLTMGGYLYEQPGIIKSLNYTIPMESTWEIAINEDGASDQSVKELPHMIKVTGLTFTPIQEFLPAKADSLLDPTQKYIALTNGITDNYKTVYEKEYYKYSPPITSIPPDIELETIPVTVPTVPDTLQRVPMPAPTPPSDPQARAFDRFNFASAEESAEQDRLDEEYNDSI